MAAARIRPVARLVGRALPVAVAIVVAAGSSAVAVGLPRPATPAVASAASVPGLVADAAQPGGRGYWALFANGRVVGAGSAHSLGWPRSASPAVAIMATPSGRGYWVVTARGGVFPFGDARSYGSARSMHLRRRIVAAASTPDGRGYWLVGATGAVHAFGDAARLSPAGGVVRSPTIVSISPTGDGHGYWLAGRAGHVWAYGDARTAAARAHPAAVVAMAATTRGTGYWLASRRGAVWTFGDAAYHGSGAGRVGSSAVVGFNRTPTGYWLLTDTGKVLAFHTPRLPSLDLASRSPLPAAAEPPASLAPSAAFRRACFGGGSDAACNAAALAGIDAARAGEGYGPLVLPKDFPSLSFPAQTLAVANAERTSRRLRPLPANATLDRLAQQGALDGEDPTGPGGYAWGSNVAWGYPTPLAADFGWMYDDGPDSPNVDCPHAGAPGCWGHRRNILAPWKGASGAGAVHTSQGWVLTELFVDGY